MIHQSQHSTFQQGVAASHRWRLESPAPQAFAEALPEMSAPVVNAIHALGFTESAAVSDYLSADLDAPNPFALAGMAEAVDRLRRARRDQETVAIYGDYDADGVTATALLGETLESLGFTVLPYIPHREREGYGLHAAALSSLAEAGARVVVTVDCGIRAAEEIDAAVADGLDIIVTDHHTLPEDLPRALAVINPRRPDCDYGFEELAGVGLAYRLAQAMLRVEDVTEGLPDLVERERSLLDLVAMGTVADVVPLVGENRALVRAGLEVLQEARRPGVRALLLSMDRQPASLTAKDIGYGLGPRLNAAGRMDDAAAALSLLRAPSLDEALPLAQALETQNSARRTAMRRALEASVLRVGSEAEARRFLLDRDPEVSMGVVGLVAGRLCERFYRPAAMIRIEGETARGSARSIEEFNVIEALDSCADLLIRHGGHARAAGFTLHTHDIPALGERLEGLAQAALAEVDLRPELRIASEVEGGALDWDLLDQIERMAPFGEGNPRPLLLLRNAWIASRRAVGKESDHLKLVVEGGSGRGSIDAIAFGRGKDALALGERADIVFELEVNEFRGRRSLQLMVKDLRSAQA